MRIEKVVQVATTSPLLTLQGQLQLDTESWGFNNVTIDVGLCQENCKLCSNFYKCQKCENGYLLYQNRCVVNCPIHSSECVDYEDIIPYSKYLAKGFYDMNMTIDQINTFYDTVTNPTTNFLTGQKFSFFRQKFVLGGLMVWNDAIYSKTWQILKPHYAISIRFNLTYGDEFSGNFYYKIDNQQSDAFVKPLTGGQNFIGREKEERTSHFYIYKDPHKSSQLSFEVQCTGGIGDIRQEFCAISEYFIIVHYCPPFCSNCESDKICNTWESGYSSSQCDANKYISFNSISQTYSCNSCTQIGCVTCNSLEECTQCDLVKNFQLSNGVCTCHPFYYLSGNQCLRCNQYCGNCNGSNNNCISCITEHFRYLSKNNCICQIGYYDDGINFICLPICGDLLIVEGEDCDDGNFNPFDGCHNCKYQCEETCLICIEGQCLMCIDGYDIVQNKCVLVCGDNLILYPEQCEDDNLIPYDGCFNCQFSCSQHCIDCQNGKCIQCDNQNGWYLFDDNTCQTICGDGIKVLYNEQCDDGNDNPFDYCDNCIFSDIAKKNNCEIFIQNRCMRCENGYQLEKRTNNCIKKCKENEIVIIKEICGDNNNMKYDGCYKCELSCQESCTNCKSQGCLECNVKGWKHNISKMKCETICGDGITILEYEECDDQINKNCQNCKFKCQESCDICLKGDCLKCKKGWYLNNYNQICYPQIGDLLVVGYEQCDDMNGIMNDGCYESQYQCQIVCISCYFGLCKKCQDGYIIINNKCIEISGDGIIVGQEECEDQNLIGLDGCFQQKYDCPLYCKICVKGQCLVCNQELGYQQFDIYKNICVSICGDNIKQIDEDCDDGNNIQFDGCFNCQFECDLYCIDCIQGICQQCMDGYYLNRKHNNCESICGDGIVVGNEQCDDGNKIIDDGCSDCKFQCHKYCIACVHGICVECRGIGWEINQINGQCQPLCGDGYIIDYEQCDDGNDIREDGCFECYFECQKECAKCIEGECMECGILGWDLEQGRCIPHCGDKLVVGDEECDDGNLIAFDGCYYCKYHCQDQCTDCKKGICYECKIEGWNILNHICYPVCGDGYVVQGYEQCDDGNQLQYDGCYLCAYQCEFKCTNCQMGICYECNQFGWIIDNYNKCIPICGDGIIIGNEQCDDMNNEYNDGCFQCQNVCDQYCTNCFNGICYSCQPGRFVYANVCVSFCGDGYYVPQNENCDDGNDLNNDGCNQNCQIEENFNCINTIGASSKCFYSKKPNIQINILTTNLQDYQEVEITFDQKEIY
ncbi:unnamed protein product [Paramecium sonneborni]|uniref:EGF-like domain-containing protein n=1 Tax=Paramecium sonneborni TaxID=65129 RepID=A0A8S1R2Z1_9CILI|nr:unnamed protein product [Paramecium sonneborni]